MSNVIARLTLRSTSHLVSRSTQPRLLQRQRQLTAAAIVPWVTNHSKSTTADFVPHDWQRNGKSQKNEHDVYLKIGTAVFAVLAYMKTAFCDTASVDDDDDDEELMAQFGKRDEKLPDYRRSEVQKHRSSETGIWVTYKHGVYDITDYIEAHPGGQTINWGLGRSMETFFDKFSIHNEPHVLELLETMRVGNVHPEDMTAEALKKNFHNPTPMHVNMESYRLVVTGKALKSLLPVNFTIEDLKNGFPTHVVKQPPRPGSNATRITKLRGVKLRDILEYKKHTVDTVTQVEFQSLAKDYKGVPFTSTLKAEDAFDDSVLVIFEANKAPLNPFQGAPIMLWNPKARGPPVKWIHKIIVS